MRLRRPLRGLAALGAALAVVLGSAAPAFAGTHDDVVATVEDSHATGESLLRPENLADPARYYAQIREAAASLRTNGAKLTAIADQAQDPGMAERVAELGIATTEFAGGLETLAGSGEAGDLEAITQVSQEVQALGQRLDQAEIDYVKFVEEHPIAAGDKMFMLWTGLFALSGLFLLIALIMAAFGGKLARLDPGVRKARRNLLAAALVFVAGAAIPAVQYWRAEPGDTYRIFYYPLIGGCVWFLVSVPAYLARRSYAKKVPPPGYQPGSQPVPPRPELAPRYEGPATQPSQQQQPQGLAALQLPRQTPPGARSRGPRPGPVQLGQPHQRQPAQPQPYQPTQPGGAQPAPAPPHPYQPEPYQPQPYQPTQPGGAQPAPAPPPPQPYQPEPAQQPYQPQPYQPQPYQPQPYQPEPYQAQPYQPEPAQQPYQPQPYQPGQPGGLQP